VAPDGLVPRCLSSALLTEPAPQVSARPGLGWEDLVRRVGRPW
jgi:hypothetical protein